MLLLLAAIALAEDPAPAPEPTPPAATIIIEGSRIARAREALRIALKEQGYSRTERTGDYVVYKNAAPWKPQVWVHDDGWVTVKRQPPRVHTPFHTFSDQGSPAEYLLCVIMPTTCVSIGGWMIGPRKLARQEERVYDLTRDEVKALNDAVAREHLSQRLNEDIPNDLAQIWADETRSVADRHLLLYTYWDTRTDTPEGNEAKEAVRSYLAGVVQVSANPYTPDELAALNATRQSSRELSLPMGSR